MQINSGAVFYPNLSTRLCSTALRRRRRGHAGFLRVTMSRGIRPGVPCQHVRVIWDVSALFLPLTLRRISPGITAPTARGLTNIEVFSLRGNDPASRKGDLRRWPASEPPFFRRSHKRPARPSKHGSGDQRYSSFFRSTSTQTTWITAAGSERLHRQHSRDALPDPGHRATTCPSLGLHNCCCLLPHHRIRLCHHLSLMSASNIVVLWMKLGLVEHLLIQKIPLGEWIKWALQTPTVRNFSCASLSSAATTQELMSAGWQHLLRSKHCGNNRNGLEINLFF